MRADTLLDETWSFGPLDRPDPAEVPDAALRPVLLPHVVAELGHRDWDPASWERTWLYRNDFPGPGEPGRRYFLRFAGALTTTRPVLNGHRLAPHAGGYLPFEREVTGLLAPRNRLDVVLDGRFDPEVPPNSANPSSAVDFWQPAGLHREVSLVARPADHVRDVFARPVRVLDAARRALRVRCELDLAVGGELVLRAELRDGPDPVAAAEGPVRAGPGRAVAELELDRLGAVRLWHPDSPRRYEVVVALLRDGRQLHEHRVRTGFRHVEFRLDGFRLNGERYPLFGLNRHQLFPFAGAAMPARVQRQDARLLREELNCTVVRCSHYPPHEAFLDACDELGLLVWDEPPGWQHLGGARWRDRALRDVHDMVVRDRNHPSVVLWAARLNETPDSPELYARTERLVHELDGSRPTTGAVLSADHDTTGFRHDVFGCNDYSASTGPDGLPRPELAPPRTDLPYLVSEAVGTLSGPAKFYRRTDPQQVQQGQAFAHARVHDLAGRDPGYAGVLAWAGFDYPSGNGNVDRGVKCPGVVDLFRVPKAGAAVYRAQVDPRRRPVVEPSFCWDLTGPSPVQDLAEAAIWSNADALELFLDDEPFAALTPARDRFPHLPHPPFLADFRAVTGIPELRVDAHLDGRPVLRRRFSADRATDRLSLRADDAELHAGGADATRVEIRVVDRYGAERQHTAGDVALELEGPAELIGPNPFPLADTGGTGAVWLRSTRGTGRVRLSARHPSAGRARVELLTRSAPVPR